MSLSIRQLLEMSRRLEVLVEKPFKASVSLKLARLKRTVEEALIDFRQKQNELIAKFGEKQLTEDGKETGKMEVKPTSPNWKEYEENLLELLAVELEVAVEPIAVAEVEDEKITPTLMEGIFTE